jgi:cysteine desulfurase/selenocysteine lyase
MQSSPRVYLDNAATSWPKPESVYAAVERCQRQLGAPAGRSAYDEAVQVGQSVEHARQKLARLMNAPDPRQIVFTANGTEALNLAIHGLLRLGDHVVTTVVEHNSVLRPLAFLQERGSIRVTYVGCDAQGIVSPDELAGALERDTRLVAITHVSNVTGAIQPVEDVVRLCRQRGVFTLVDAAQSLGHLPCDVQSLGVDLLASPGHKGLLGPLGTGLLYLRPGMEDHVESRCQGGTGTQSEFDRQPDELPEKYESGNLNAPGILGLGAGAEYLLDRGIEAVRRHEVDLTDRLLAGLRRQESVRIHGPQSAAERAGVVSITLEHYDPQEVAAVLDAAYRVQVRAGLHCAPRMHQALGTLSVGGTMRFSLGAMTTASDIDIAVDAMAEIAASDVSRT